MSWSLKPKNGWLTFGKNALIGVIAGIMTMSAWPYVMRNLGSAGQKLGIHVGGAPLFDPFGLLPRRDRNYFTEAPRRMPRGGRDYPEAPWQPLRPTPWDGYGKADNDDGFRRDRYGHPYRRWMECTGSRQHPQCGDVRVFRLDNTNPAPAAHAAPGWPGVLLETRRRA